MAWQTIGSTIIGDANTNYGHVYLQYDDASGNPRSVRLRYENDVTIGAYIYVYVNNLSLDGSVVANQILLDRNMDIWTGTMNPGNHTMTWSCPWNTGTRSYSVSGNVPSSASPPTGLGANNIVPGVESFTGNVYISGWGAGSGTRYRELQCWTYDPNNLVQPRRYQVTNGDALSGNITVTNSSSGDLTIRGNTMYTLGCYATNGSASVGSQRIGNYTTLAYAPVLTADVGKTEAIIAYELKADGGQYPKTYEYSTDGGTTWTQFDSVLDGNAKTGSFTISGDFQNNPITLKARVTTTAGTTNAKDIYVVYIPKNKFYGSLNEKTRRITKFYGSVGNQTTRVVKFYGSAGGVTKRII